MQELQFKDMPYIPIPEGRGITAHSGKRTTPSESVIFRYLSKFHDKEQRESVHTGGYRKSEGTDEYKQRADRI
ncbi:MAG: hypothetical protein HQK99_16290 [Nitrospirae bacterium]|nr:hypothetical protein [Nitrospirota bacterium]